jgi:fimbrial chaperone protein
MNSQNCKSLRITVAIEVVAAVALSLAGHTAGAQSLSVVPVNVFMQPGQKAATLTVKNSGSKSTSIQVRVFDWSQKGNEEQLTPSNIVVASPPLMTIEPEASQVVRLILRQSPTGREATYRIVLDQIPGPNEPGTVQMVLRLSIPIFAMPATKAAPKVQFQLQRDGDKLFLVGVNVGLSHEVLRDAVVTAADGHKMNVMTKASPYILAGVTKHWELDTQGYAPQPGETLKLTADGATGPIIEQIGVTSAP